ncbi:MAG: SDR family NAD(P)-dependent oxidoreductase, partial [Aeoliella sp.]
AEPLTAMRGHLVLVGSLASHVAPRYLGAYPASKFPLAAIAQQLRLELGPSGLHTLLVCPGPIARHMLGDHASGDKSDDRYQAEARGVPASAGGPGGGAKVLALDPHNLAERILKACQRRRSELVLPRKARLLFVLNQISPRLGDWLLKRMTG